MPLEFAEPERLSQVTDSCDLQENAARSESLVGLPSDLDNLARERRELSMLAIERRRSYLRWHAGLSATSVVVWAMFSAMMLLAPHSAGKQIGASCLFATLIAALICVGGYLRGTRANRRLHALLYRAVEADNPVTTGALIDILSLDDARATQSARMQLAKLAAQWTEADLAALTPEQRDGLRRIVDGVQTRRHGDASGITAESHAKREVSLKLRVSVCEALGALATGRTLQP